jgi:PEP-CTERM motif
VKNIFTKLAATTATGAFLSVGMAIEAPKAQAISLSITNAGFETPVLGDDQFTDQLGIANPPGITDFLPGWDIYDPNGILASFTGPEPTTGDFPSVGVWNPPARNYPGEAPEGNNVGFVYLPTYSPKLVTVGSGVVGISQTLSSGLTAKTLYTLKVNVGNTTGINSSFPSVTEIYTGFPGYEVQLLAGGNILATESALTPAEGTFATSVLSFVTTADNPYLGTPLQIRLINKNAAGGANVDFDNVKLEATAVPEPASVLGLLAFGALGATVTRKKKLAAQKAEA